MFGSSDRPLNDEEADEFQGHDMGDAVNAVLKPKRPRRTDSGGDDNAAWRLKFWQRHGAGTPTNAAVAAQQAGGGDGRHIRSQTSFRHFFNRNKKSGVDLEATLDQDLQELEDGGDTSVLHRRSATTAAGNNQRAGTQRSAQRKGRSPVRPSGVAAGSNEDGVVDLGDVEGGKLKAAVKRALAASRREKEAAARRGRQKRREEQELGDFQGFIQVKDPALDKSCVEYGLTAELAETKYRWEAGRLCFGSVCCWCGSWWRCGALLAMVRRLRVALLLAGVGVLGFCCTVCMKPSNPHINCNAPSHFREDRA